MSKTKFGVVVFPGSNCDEDCLYVLRDVLGAEVRPVWHKEASLDDVDALVLPGGFSYGDYLRAGSIARFSPVMKAVLDFAKKGRPVIGICNGFQILLECGLLPGAMMRNRTLSFECSFVTLRVESTKSPFTQVYQEKELVRIPVAHGEGNYVADQETLKKLNANEQILLRYVNEKGEVTEDANPNGSLENIAGICNEKRNVFGLMPHPERASEEALGSIDGRKMFESITMSLVS